MIRWITLLAIQVATAPETWRYYSSVAASGPDAFYEPLVLDFGSLTRAIPVKPGLPTISDITVTLSNNTLEFSNLLDTVDLRGKKAILKIGREDTEYDSFQQIFCGKITGVQLTGPSCILQIKDFITDRLQETIHGEISSALFPALDLMDSVLVPCGPVVYGNCQADGGRVPCQYVGQGSDKKHQYVVAQHEVEVLQVYKLTSLAGETISYDVVVDGDLGWTFLLFDEDQEDPENVGGEIAISADVKGYKHGNPAALIENPAIALRHYLVTYAGFTLSDFDNVLLSETADKLDTAGIKISGVITSPATHEQVIAWFCQNFSLDFWVSPGGQICIGYNRYDASIVPGQTLSDRDGQILKNGYKLAYNQAVANEMTLRHSYNPVFGEYGKTMENLENLVSQEAVGKFTENLDLCLVGDDHTAQMVAGIRLFWSDEQRQFVTLTLSAPTLTALVELGGLVLVSHFAGPNTAGLGWVDKPVKVLEMQYQLNGAPILRLSGVVYEANDHSYAYGTPPDNVVAGTVSESNSTSELTATWTLAGNGNDPTWVWAYYKRSTEPLSRLRFGGYVEASAGTITLLPEFPASEDSDSLDLVLAAESSTGVLRHLSDCTKLTLASVDRKRLASVSGLDVTPGDPGINVITVSWSPITDLKFRNCWIWRGTSAVFTNAIRVAYDITGNSWVDTDITPEVEYYYFVQALTKSGANNTKVSAHGHVDLPAGGIGPSPELPVYDQPPKVTGFSVTEETMVVDANGSMKSRVAVVFEKPDSSADPDGLWKTAKIYRGKLVQSSPDNPVGDQGATVGGSTTKFDVVAELTESAAVILEPWAESSVFAAVSTVIKNNVAIEGKVDSLQTDASYYQETKSWAELQPDGKFAQSFVLEESRNIARWDFWLKRAGNTFTSAASLRLLVVDDLPGTGPDENSVIASSTNVLCTGIGVDPAGGWIKFSFTTPATLTAGVKYWLVLDACGTYAEEFVTGESSVSLAWAGDGTSYSGGEWAEKQSDDWVLNTGRDAIFRNYTFYYPRVIVTLTPAQASWAVEDFFVTAKSGGKPDGIDCDIFTATWDIPQGIDGAIVECFDLAYSAMQGFNADIPATGTPAEVTYARGLPGTSRMVAGSDPGKTYYFAIRARQKDGPYTEWTYFGQPGCDANASLRTAVTSYFPIGRIMVEDFRIYSYGFRSGKLYSDPRGFEIQWDGNAEFNDVFIRTGAVPGTLTSGLIYAGSILGDYEKDWFGVFMNSTGLVGRRNLSGTGTPNPAVFLLGAQDYDSRAQSAGGDYLGDTSDPVHPSIGAGDFCVSSDVKRAYEYGDVPYLLFRPSGYCSNNLSVLISPVDATDTVWSVAYAEVFSAGQYIMCGAEICRIQSIDSANDLVFLCSTCEVRNQYFGTVASAHEGGELVGIATNGATLKIRGQVDIIGNSTISGTLGIIGETNGLWIGESQMGANVSITGLGIGIWADFPHTTDNLAFAAWASDFNGYLPGPGNVPIPVSAAAGDVWLRRAYIGPWVDSQGVSHSMEILPNSITSANFVEGPAGSGWKLFTDGSAEFQQVRVRVSGGPSDSHLVYAGSMEGNYSNDWYGIFMSADALVGRVNIAGNTTPNPAVFLLTSATFSGDAVLPAFGPGEFCLAPDIKAAYDDPDSVEWFIKASIAGGLQIKGDLTVMGSTLSASTGHIHLDGDGIYGHDPDEVLRFVMTNVDKTVRVYKHPSNPSLDIYMDLLAGEFAAWHGQIAGVLISFNKLQSLSYQASGGTSGYCINDDGSATFQSITAKGTIQATGGFIGATNTTLPIESWGIAIGPYGKITSNSLISFRNVDGYDVPTESEGVFIGYDTGGNLGGRYKFFAGDGHTGGNYIAWNGSQLIVKGTLFAEDGTIGGWNIGSTTLESGNVGFYSGGSTVRIYAGDTFANRAIAPLQIHANGTLDIGKTGTGYARTYLESYSSYSAGTGITELIFYGPPWSGSTPSREITVGAIGYESSGSYYGYGYLTVANGGDSRVVLKGIDPIIAVFNASGSPVFRVSDQGDITKINGITYAFPDSQGGAGTVLTNDGNGNLSWA